MLQMLIFIFEENNNIVHVNKNKFSQICFKYLFHSTPKKSRRIAKFYVKYCELFELSMWCYKSRLLAVLEFDVLLKKIFNEISRRTDF